jgi:hypothetical protein
MRLFNNWKFYAVVIATGLSVWLVFFIISAHQEPATLNKTISPRSLYEEIVAWGKIIGQVMAGAGTIAGTFRVILERFNKKKVKMNAYQK